MRFQADELWCGRGACGKTNSDSDFIVALNQAQYGSGSDCFKEITITANGKTHGATIVDECSGCQYAGLDMSKALFDFFAAESVGVITGSWDFASGGGGSSSWSRATHSTHTTTSTKQTTSSTEKSTSSHTETSTFTSPSPSSSSSSTSTSINYLTGNASGSAEPTGAVGPGAISNLNDMNQVIIDLGALIVAGGNGD